MWIFLCLSLQRLYHQIFDVLLSLSSVDAPERIRAKTLHRDLKNWPIFSLLEPDFVSKLTMVMVFGQLGDEAFMVTKDDTVYALGNNLSGCLGVGDTHSTLNPKRIADLSQKKIKTFACGVSPHVLALTESGEVYSWGNNGFGQLGNGTIYPSCAPIKIPFFRDCKVLEVACGSHHCLALTAAGKVYAWGRNTRQQVRAGKHTMECTPYEVTCALSQKRVVGISCRHSSSTAITSCGKVYSWGDAEGCIKKGLVPIDAIQCKLDGIVIEKIACGYSHTLALSTEHALYVWGGNANGQLGLGTLTDKELPQELRVPEMGMISDIGATKDCHISVALTNNGQVYIWGHCRFQNVSTPTLTPFTSIHEALAAYAIPSVMHTPLKLCVDEDKGVLACLKQAFDDPSTSDLTIRVHGKSIRVHKTLLKLRCQYFRSMFQEHWKESNQTVIESNEFSYEVYKEFLRYLYTDEVELAAENGLELLCLANEYIEPELEKLCIRIIKQGITVDNVVFIYKKAIDFNCGDLESACFKFAMNHMTAVVQTPGFVELDETTVKTFIAKVATAGLLKT